INIKMLVGAIRQVPEFLSPELDAHIRVAVTAIKQNAPELIMDWCERVINCTRNIKYQNRVTGLMEALLIYALYM
ncbi:hypothetical protein ACLBP5_30570, partial [Klebsiella pneumoniae]